MPCGEGERIRARGCDGHDEAAFVGLSLVWYTLCIVYTVCIGYLSCWDHSILIFLD